jgi:hypothetical protein
MREEQGEGEKQRKGVGETSRRQSHFIAEPQKSPRINTGAGKGLNWRI